VAKKPRLPTASDFFNLDNMEAEPKPNSDSKARQKPATEKSASRQRTVTSGAEQVSSGNSTALSPSQLHLQVNLKALSSIPPHTIAQTPTEKVTFYIPPQMLQDIEVCRVRLLTEHNVKVTRSQIAQAALALTSYDPALIHQALLQLDQAAQDVSEE